MRTAIYVRVSTRDQNPENQQLQLEEYAKRMGWDYEVFQEKESTKKTRPVKEKVLGRLRNKDFDALLIWKLDRWGRSLTELVINLEELTKRGIKIISLQDNIDYTTASGQLFANLLSCFAQYERSIISERTHAGLRRAKARGKKLGRPKGSKDKKPRRKSGYHLRWMNR